MHNYDSSAIVSSIVLTSIIRLSLDNFFELDVVKSMGIYALILDYCYTWTRLIITLWIMNALQQKSPIFFVIVAAIVELISTYTIRLFDVFNKNGTQLFDYVDNRTFDMRFVIVQYVLLSILSHLNTNINFTILAWSLIYYITSIYQHGPVPSTLTA